MAPKPVSVRSNDGEASERSPLLPPSTVEAAEPVPELRPRRWSSILALIFLSAIFIGILAAAFIAPAAAERYAHSSVILDLDNISVDSVTDSGVRVRVTSKVHIDASRVSNPLLRTLGRAGARVVRKVHVDPEVVNVYVPDYEGRLMGKARVPPMTVDIRDGKTTRLDVVADAEPGELEAVMMVVDRAVKGGLEELRVRGEARVRLRTTFFEIGTRDVSSEVVLKGE